jgi:hypothetical protein
MSQGEQTFSGTESSAGSTFRLIYRSKSRIPEQTRKTELGEIFSVARSNNKSLGITGALLLYDDKFAQTLEGGEAAVRELYARIEADERHEAVEVIEAGLVDAPVFSRWAMAQVGEHHEADIPLIATTRGIAAAGGRSTTSEQERVLDRMRDATRGFGRGF